MTKEIFTYASNEAGIHGAGSALHARMFYGAKIGQGIGLVGNSYGIPTKDKNIKTLPLLKIFDYVQDFVQFAKDNPDMTFKVVKIGTGLAGYTNEDIAPMFMEAPSNCVFDPEWVEIIKTYK